MSNRIAIVGGGLSGLVAAYEVGQQDPNADVVIFEASHRLGGKLKTVDIDAGSIDVGAEAYLAYRTDATEFFTSLGLHDRIRYPSNLTSGLWTGDGILHSVPSQTVMGIPSHSSSVNGLVDAETCDRIDAEGKAYPIPWNEGEDALIGSLVGARMGQQVVDHVVSPLLGGVYSTRADDLGLRATIPDLAAAMDDLVSDGEPVTLTGAAARVLRYRGGSREARVAGGPADADSSDILVKKPPVFASFVGGYRDVINALVDKTSANIQLNSPILSVSRSNGTHRFSLVVGSAPPRDCGHAPISHENSGVYLEGSMGGNNLEGDSPGRCEEFDAVIISTPADAAGRQLAEVAPVASDIIGSVGLASSVVLGLRLSTDHGLPERTGILISPDAGLHAKAFTFSSRKWPHVADQVGTFIRASFGHWSDDSLVHEDKNILVTYALEDLEAITGSRFHVEEAILQRWWGGLPRFGVGHDALISVATREIEHIAGLEMAGATWRGVGVPDCIVQAREAARKVMAQIG
ncbi:FAD-dependent oxidoreductase [Corynebacterium kroppenstedtii]|uniref:FAD-dependent oxidoreductase n=1 Tax=Corynebacterium sp. PCR 32 TaxID=3351342 RepID=UPI0030B26000